MSSNDQVFDAVASIESPLLVGRTLGELGLVKAVDKTMTGKVKLELSVPVAGIPESINDQLQEVLAPYARGADVSVEMMEDEAINAWMNELIESAGPGLGEPGSNTRTMSLGR